MASNNILHDAHLKKLSAPQRSIAQISNKASLKEALSVMVKAKVYTLPVNDADSGAYVGLISLGAVVSAIVKVFSDKLGGLEGLRETSLDQQVVDDATYAFNALKIGDEHITKVEPAQVGLSLAKAIDFFAKPGNATNHVRLPVVDDEGVIVNVASPNMIVKFLGANLDSLDANVVGRRLASIPGVVSSSVRTVPSSASVLYAFGVCTSSGYSAVGIEDPESNGRKIVSIVSLKDVIAAASNFAKLFTPVEEYVNEIRRADLVDRVPTINISADESLANCISKFVAIKRHRMFVRDPKSNDLVGIVTLADILKAFQSK